MNGSAVKEYLNWKEFFLKYIKYAPLHTPMQNFSGTEQLLASEASSQWGAIKKKLIVADDLPIEEQIEEALEEFGCVYIKSMARRDQKRYLCRYCFEPKDMSV